MNPESVGALIAAAVMLLGLLGGVLSLTYRIGHMSGKIDSFMANYERDRADLLKDIGRIEERHERHVEGHDMRGTK